MVETTIFKKHDDAITSYVLAFTCHFNLLNAGDDDNDE